MAKIRKIEPVMPTLPTRKKVAAYARVSMETERLHHSLSAQVSYYSDLIQRNPEWEYAGVYADDGITGTKANSREEFQRMLEDCEAGKIDIILTKSISRFARNTVDLLETVRHLKELGVSVRFEKENIDSLSGDGEVMLTLLASFAQEEITSLSNNVKWGIRKRFEKGIPNFRNKILGYEWEDDHLVVVPEEAAIVKRIFQNFLDGKSRLETERELNGEGITTKAGCKWCDSNIKVVLSNITYTGNLLLQKEYIADPISKKRKRNHGELPQYYVADHHEPIIDKETFDYVQAEMKRRRELGARANKSLNITCFTGMIKCPHCGLSYMRDTKKGNDNVYWICGSHKKRKVGDGCPVRGAINQKSIERACCEVLGLETFDEEVFHEKVERVFVPEKTVMEFHLKDGTVVNGDCTNRGHQECWTAEYRAETSRKRQKNPTCKKSSGLTGKIKCGNCGCNLRRQIQPCKSADGGRHYFWRCPEQADGCEKPSLRDDILKGQIAEAMGTEGYDEEAFSEKVDFISVLSAAELELHFVDGRIVRKTYVKPKRQGRKWTPEQRAKFSESIKGTYTPERRQKMSEHMKQLRKERGKAWRKA